jgi:agmatine deiminase
MTTSKADPLHAEPNWRMPAEWEPHAATWIAWPHQREDWPGKFAAIPWVYAEIVQKLCPSERVRILVNDAAAEKRARGYLGKVPLDWDRVEFFHFPTDRVWTRDYAPLFVKNNRGEKALTDWHFNGWAKYDNWRLDDAVPARIAERFALPSQQPVCRGKRVVLEGGSIDVNGQGLLLTTEECLLSPIQARNPDLTKNDLEKVFIDHLGVKKVLWLDRGIVGDDTHGHVDDLARFVGPRTVVAVVENKLDDANYWPLQENLDRLRRMTDLVDRPIEVLTLPMPSPVVFRGQRLPASYANFYIANDVVLAPTFNDPNDRKALGVLADVFPGRQVIGIHAVDLVWGLGTLHCLTQQEPA